MINPKFIVQYHKRELLSLAFGSNFCTHAAAEVADTMAASSPASGGASPPWSVINPTPNAHDPIDNLEQEIGKVVAFFGPNGRETLQKCMQQDNLAAQNLTRMENSLKAQGDWDGAKRIVKYVKKASSNSLHQIIPMRGHLEEVAELLIESMDTKVQTDASALREVLLSIHSSAQEAQKIARDGKQHFEDVAQEVEDLKKQYESKAEKAKCEAEQYQQLADKKGRAAKESATVSGLNAVVSGTSSVVPLGNAGIGIVGATAGAQAVSSIPVIGAALTTTTTTTASAGGLSGLFGSTVTTTAVVFNPVGLMVGTAFAVGFGLLALKSGADAWTYGGQKHEALAEKGEAEKQKEACEKTVKESKETQQIAEKMVDTANIHESLWEGVSISADLAAQKFNQLKRIDPQGSRRYKFDQKMKAYASDMCDMVKAIDEYLFCLEKLGFLPPNFHLESVVGQTRYCEIDKAMKSAQSQLAALTAEDSSSPAPAVDSRSGAPAAQTAVIPPVCKEPRAT